MFISPNLAGVEVEEETQLKSHDSLFKAERLFRINRVFFVFTVERHPWEKIRSLADYWVKVS